jgi:hypothetical protein
MKAKIAQLGELYNELEDIKDGIRYAKFQGRTSVVKRLEADAKQIEQKIKELEQKDKNIDHEDHWESKNS